LGASPAQRQARKAKPVMLWQHRTDQPIGVWDELVKDFPD
jgi:hypothetical protein